MESEFRIREDESLRFGNRLYVTKNSKRKKEILLEAHNSSYTMHLGSTY